MGWIPKFEKLTTGDAGAAFFGITYSEAVGLFESRMSATPKQIAKLVRKLIRQYERQS